MRRALAIALAATVVTLVFSEGAEAQNYRLVCYLTRDLGRVCTYVAVANSVANWAQRRRPRVQQYYNQRAARLGPRPWYMPAPRPMYVPQPRPIAVPRAQRLCYAGRCY